MRPDWRLLFAMLAPGAALGLWLAAGGWALRAALDPAQRAAVDAALGPLAASHGMLAVLWWLVAAALAAWAARRLHGAAVSAPARLADATQVLVGDAAAPDLGPAPSASLRPLAEAINGLAQQRRSLQQEMARLVDEAGRDVARQRDQLGALMAELRQSVVVCNPEGRILLYNAQARDLFRRLSRAPEGAAGAELIGLGRSIHAVIERPLIVHALETIERRTAGGGDPGSSARFVTTTPAGHLIRVNLASVRRAGAADPALEGFVLILDDITEEYAAESRRDRQVLELAERSRGALGNMQAALEVLEYPDLDAEQRDRLAAVVRDEVAAMSARFAAFAADTSQYLMTRWPLQDMLGADLLAAAQQRIAADQGETAALEADDPTPWLRVDSFALIRALAFLAGRLVAAGGRPELRLRLARAGGRARLDLAWSAKGADPELALGWQDEPMDDAADGAGALSVRDVVRRHDGELWIERDRDGGPPAFRFLLPLATSEPAPAQTSALARPEYYDFDLFAVGDGDRALDDRLLSELAYTVFDTETTGLNPSDGDEIIQIGATRIVNGKLLRGECFDQLVDPQRSIPEASVAIHGIQPEQVRGKPTIAEVLPALRAFVGDTVLVGHNVAFDLSFLRRKEEVSGVRFDLPVLDTLLLSSLVHPNETAHGLDAIGGRLGVPISSRHAALGDAFSTAEVFLRLLPLLRQRGIQTLAQAREAARSSYYARLRY